MVQEILLLRLCKENGQGQGSCDARAHKVAGVVCKQVRQATRRLAGRYQSRTVLPRNSRLEILASTFKMVEFPSGVVISRAKMLHAFALSICRHLGTFALAFGLPHVHRTSPAFRPLRPQQQAQASRSFVRRFWQNRELQEL